MTRVAFKAIEVMRLLEPRSARSERLPDPVFVLESFLGKNRRR
jgi:hypothetical protein